MAEFRFDFPTNETVEPVEPSPDPVLNTDPLESADLQAQLKDLLAELQALTGPLTTTPHQVHACPKCQLILRSFSVGCNVIRLYVNACQYEQARAAAWYLLTDVIALVTALQQHASEHAAPAVELESLLASLGQRSDDDDDDTTE